MPRVLTTANRDIFRIWRSGTLRNEDDKLECHCKTKDDTPSTPRWTQLLTDQYLLRVTSLPFRLISWFRPKNSMSLVCDGYEIELDALSFVRFTVTSVAGIACCAETGAGK